MPRGPAAAPRLRPGAAPRCCRFDQEVLGGRLWHPACQAAAGGDIGEQIPLSFASREPLHSFDALPRPPRPSACPLRRRCILLPPTPLMHLQLRIHLPCSFFLPPCPLPAAVDEYVCTFDPLVLEEAREGLKSDWAESCAGGRAWPVEVVRWARGISKA